MGDVSRLADYSNRSIDSEIFLPHQADKLNAAAHTIFSESGFGNTTLSTRNLPLAVCVEDSTWLNHHRRRHHRAMRCDAMRCDAMRCDAMRCDAMRCE